MISGIVFTIFASPTIVIINPIEIENIDLANDILTQFLYTGVMIVILVLGFKPTKWRIKGKGPRSLLIYSQLGRHMLILTP